MKHDLYQRLGVPAYWIVDPAGPKVTVYRLPDAWAEGRRYEIETEAGSDDELATDWPFPVRIPPADLIS